MNEKQENIAAMLARGASVHRLAACIIAHKRGQGPLWQSAAAALLSALCKIQLRDAKAVISEMSLD